jgi:hypothetical protein
MAACDGAGGPDGDYPESRYVPDYSANLRLGPAALAGGALLGVAVGAAMVATRRRDR